MLYYELKKLLLNKTSVLLLLLLCILNTAVYTGWSMRQEIDREDYRRLHERLEHMSLQEGKAFLQQEEAAAVYDRSAVERIERELEGIEAYPAFLASIKEGNKQSISIFQKEHSYAAKVKEKLAGRYQDLEVSLEEIPSAALGIEALLRYPLTAFFLFVYTLYLLYEGVHKELETGFFTYRGSMSAGGWQYIFTKLGALLFCLLLAELLCCGGMLLVSGALFGSADLLAPIQSVLLCQSVPDALSIGGFLLWMALLHFASIALFVTLAYALACLLRHVCAAVAIVALLLGGCQMISAFASDPQSAAAFLSLKNLLYPVFPYMNVVYVSLLEQPVSFSFLFLMFAFLTVLLLLAACKMNGNVRFRKKRAFLVHRRGRCYPILLYELKKVWLQGLALVFALLLFGGVFLSVWSIDTLSGRQDIEVAHYIDTIGARASAEAKKGIAAEEARFEALQKRLAESEQRNEQSMLSEELNRYSSFEVYRERLEKTEARERSEVLKEDETRLFFGMRKQEIAMTAGTLLLLLYASALTYEREHASGVVLWQKTSGMSERLLLRKKLFSIAAIALAALMIYQGFLLWKNIQMYPHADYGALLSDLQELPPSSCSVSILCYLLIQSVLQMITVLSFVYILLHLFSDGRYWIVKGVACLLAVLLPVLLELLGVLAYSPWIVLFYPYHSLPTAVVWAAVLLLAALYSVWWSMRSRQK